MTKWSIIAGMLGIIAAVVAITRPRYRTARRCWLLGAASLFPAWLLAFIALLGTSVRDAEVSLPQPVILSSSAALLGLIISDFLQRHLESSGRGHSILTYWIIGTASFVPGWCIAVLILGRN